MSTLSQSADRNLLFGVLALQADLLDPNRFAEACSAWAARKDTLLANLLVERGWLSAEERGHVEFLLDRKLKKHQGDVRASLAEVATEPVRECAAGLADAEVRKSLLGTTPPAPGPVLLTATTVHIPVQGERYTLSRLHATGGIGRVWLARDASLGRDVALKELRPERAGNAAVWARFLKEAQITGQLEHPGIVPIYEVSQRPDEHPFYTMRFVRGKTLSEAVAFFHARRKQGEAGPLELRELLGAFVGVCNAVAYAHSRGVIHRDVKPQNVVLGDYGEVMVLDWGLARLLGQPEGEGDLAPLQVSVEEKVQGTVVGQVLGTPAYMAPEQAEGRLDLLGPATDIYGLGAILYEMLAGQPPFAGSETTAVLRQVVHEPPAPPRWVVAETPRPLEAVCLKALAKKPAGRYDSASELASEIRHYLADEPVSAYADPLLVRLGRKARRHRSLVAGLAAAALVAVASLTAATALLSAANRREAEARELAEHESARAQDNFQLARDAVDEYCTKVSNDPRLKEKDLEDLRKELLQTATKFHEKFVQHRGDDPQQRADLGRAYVRLGRLTAQIGDHDRAISLMRQGQAIFEELVVAHADSAEYQDELADSLSGLANWMSGTGSRPEAIDFFHRSRAIYEKLVQDYPGTTKYAIDLGGVYCDMADIIRFGGEREEGLRLFKLAVQTLEPVCRQDKENERAQRYLANSYESQGNNYRVLHRHKEGIAACLRALPLREQLLAKNPRIPLYEEDLSRTLHVLALLYEHDGQEGKALDILRQSLALVERSAANHPTVTSFRWAVAGVHLNLGNRFRFMRRPVEAEENYQKALAMYQVLAERHRNNLQYRMEIALVHLDLGGLNLDLGKLDKAAEHFRLMADTLTGLEPTYPRVLELCQSLTHAYAELIAQIDSSDHPERRANLTGQILGIRRYLTAAQPKVTSHKLEQSSACANLGHVLGLLKRREDGIASYEQAIRILRGVLEKETNHTQARYLLSNSYFGLAGLYDADKNDEAEKNYTLGLAISEQLVAENLKVPGYQHALGNMQNNLANIYQRIGKVDRAVALHQQAVRVRERLATDHPKIPSYVADLAISYFNLATAQEKAQRLDLALAASRQAFDLQEKLVADHPMTERYQTDLARTSALLAPLYFRNGKIDEGITALERERDMQGRLARAHPSKTSSLARFARTQRKLGDLYVIARKSESAVQSFTEAACVLGRLSAEVPPGEASPYLSDVANIFAGLGSAYTARGKADQAIAAFDRSAAFIDRMTLNLPGLISCQAALVKGYIALGERSVKERNSGTALEAYRRAQGPAKLLVAASPGDTTYENYLISAVVNPGTMYATRGRMDLALQVFAEALPVLEPMDSKRPQVAGARAALVKNLGNLGDYFSKKTQIEPAIEAYRLAVEQARKLVAAHPDNDQFLFSVAFGCVKLGRLYQNTGKWELAQRTYREQLEAIEKLIARKPGVSALTTLLGATHHDLGQAANGLAKHADAIAEFERAIALLEDALKKEKNPQLLIAPRQWLCTSHGGRAYALLCLNRNKEAAEAYDRARELASGRQRAQFQLKRAVLLARAGAHAGPVADAEEAIKLKGIAAGELYSAACVLSLASSAVTRDSKIPVADQKKLAEHYAVGALAFLDKSRAAGYFRNAAMIAHLKKDSDLDPLRQRPEYGKLVAELEGKGKPDGKGMR